MIFLMNTKSLIEMEKPELIDRVVSLEDEVTHLSEQLESLRRQIFGPRSERIAEAENSDQLGLFENPEEMASASSGDEEETEDISYTRKKRGAKKPKDLSHLPKRYIDMDGTEDEKNCSNCPEKRPFIAYEETPYLNYQPSILELLIIRKAVYGQCKKCEACEPPVVIVAAPNRILPGTFVTEAVLAWICVCKVIDRMTLYHLEKQLNSRYQVPISRQTMARWMIQIAPKLQPLVTVLKEVLWEYDVMWVDATWFQVLNEETKKPESKSYAYCAVGGPPGKQGVIFEYSKNHHDFLKDFLLDWEGYLHCDALNCYDYLEKDDAIIKSLCNCHARRKFADIIKSKKKKAPVAKAIVKLYTQLYKLEKHFKIDPATPEEIKTLRAQHIKPLMDQIKAIVDEKLPITSKSTQLYDALKYTHDHWSGLIQFLNDGRLDPDNNRCERMIKYFALSRKNFLFADSVAGAEALTVHFSLLITAQMHGLEPIQYYTKVLKEIPNCRPDHFEDYAALLPWNINLNS